jgi:Coenzyme PQQ synthesis protein D (PqqD)
MLYRVNSPQVISETVGGETIIVDLGSGHYFNLQGTAVDVWSGLERQEPVSAIVRRLEARYETGAEPIGASVEAFVADLESAALIVAESNGAAPAAVDEPAPVDGEREPFVAPTFTRFTDMQDIILLDPVHEVDSTGWPHASAAS